MIELKKIAHYVSDKINVSALKAEEYVSTDNMLPNRGGVVSGEALPEATRVTKYQQGDVLVSNIRPYFKKIWFANKESGCSNDVIVFRTNGSNWNKKFLYYVLSQDSFFNFMMAGANGTKMPRGDKKTIPQFLVPDYKIEKQNKIASILSAYDDLIENNKKQIKLLEEAAQRLYKEWFVDLHFPDWKNTSIVDGVPEGWKFQTLSEIADIVMGQSPKSEFYNQDKQGLPFHQGVGSYGTRFVIDNIYSTSFTRIAKSGSILFSVRAPVGRLNLTKNKIVIGRGLAAINHRSGMQSYMFYLLKERFFKDNIIGNGSIFASISKDELLGQKFIIPPDNLVEQFNGIARNYDGKLDRLTEQNSLLTEARNRLLPKLMNGELNV